MRSDNSTGLRVAGHQTCVVYDKKTGKVAHIHDCITFEGAELPSKEHVESRAMQLTRQFAAKRPGIKLDRLEVLHVKPEELEKARAPMVDVKARKLVAAAAGPAATRKAKTKRAAPKRPKAKRAARPASKRGRARS
jgi:hypothetical protein